MDKDDQYLLFALSTPMEILNCNNSPSHFSPRMYEGMKFFDLASSWGIENRDELIQTIYRMTDDGHATHLAGFYYRWFRFSPQEWQEFICEELDDRSRIYAQFAAETAMCCGEGGIRAWDYVRMGFLCRVGVLNKWLTEEESLWLQSRVHLRAQHFYSDWVQYYAAYSLGRLYWQAPEDEGLEQLKRFLVRKEYDQAGERMFQELVSQKDSFYATLPWRPLANYPTCPGTLMEISDL